MRTLSGPAWPPLCHLSVSSPAAPAPPQDEAQSQSQSVETELEELRTTHRETRQRLETCQHQLTSLQTEKRFLDTQLAETRSQAGVQVRFRVMDQFRTFGRILLGVDIYST